MSTQDKSRGDIRPDEKTKKTGMEDLQDADLTKVQGGSSPIHPASTEYGGTDTMNTGGTNDGRGQYQADQPSFNS